MAEYIERAKADAYTVRLTELTDECIKKIAQAVVKELIGGRWIKNEDRHGWHCSECKEDNLYAYSWSSESGKYEFQDNYCPNCGARMDEEK